MTVRVTSKYVKVNNDFLVFVMLFRFKKCKYM